MAKGALLIIVMFILYLPAGAQMAVFKQAHVQSFSKKKFFHSLTIQKQQFKNLILVADTILGDDFWIPAQEVTNEEYRNFTTYCRDSTARMLLNYVYGTPRGEEFIDWKKNISWKGGNFAEKILPLLDINTYGKHNFVDVRLDVIATKVLYGKWTDTNNIVAVYPDTLCWIKEKADTAKSKNYFSSPSFNNYPVVGVSYWQAVAYCRWLTQMWNSALQKAGNTTNYFEVQLPDKQNWVAASKMETAQHGNTIFSKSVYVDYKNTDYNLSGNVAGWLYDSKDLHTNTASIKEITETSWEEFRNHRRATAQHSYIGFRYIVKLKTKGAATLNEIKK